jgi:microcystin-dependent protein
MARVTGFTAARMQEIEDTCIVSGAVLLDNLHLTQRDGTVIDAGNVRGPQGTAAAITGVSVVGLAAGAAPTVDAGGTPMARTFQFGIPKGDQGIQGIQGPSGTITSATATGLAAGAAPTIGLGGTPQARTLTFGIPKGDTGADGVAGSLATPAGTIALWGSDVAPANWMICDGSAISRTTYASLFAVIGTKYGAGDGVNTFNLPNLKGRTPVGKDAAQTEFAAVAQIGGEKAHLLTTAEMPSHTHGFGTGVNVPDLVTGASSYYWNAPTGPDRVNAISATAATGGGTAHNILQPYSVVNFIIKVTNGDTPGDSQLTQRVSTLEGWMGQTPAGTMTIWGGDTAPTNWLLCDDAAISRTTYASLFSVIGTKYGAGDGSTTFNLPNLKGKVPTGLDTTQTEFNTLGKTGGTKVHSHQHVSPVGSASGQPYVLDVNSTDLDLVGHYDFQQVITTPNAGGLAAKGTGLNERHVVTSSDSGTLQPYLTVNYVIKYTNGDTQGDSQLTQRVSDLESGVSYSVKLRDKMSRLQQVLVGGGYRKVDVSKGISWSERFIMLGTDTDPLSPVGYFQIDMPANGTVIPVYSKTSLASITVTNGYIPMDDWGALYYDVPIGGLQASDPSRFKYVSYANDTGHRIPPSWVLIAVRKLDTYSPLITWGDGVRQDFWKNLGLASPWYYYSGASTAATDYAPASWRIAHDGKIELRGLVGGGTVGQNIFTSTLLGPEQRAIYTVVVNGGVGRVDVTYDGTVAFMWASTGATGAFLSLEGIAWYPHQTF